MPWAGLAPLVSPVDTWIVSREWRPTWRGLNDEPSEELRQDLSRSHALFLDCVADEGQDRVYGPAQSPKRQPRLAVLLARSGIASFLCQAVCNVQSIMISAKASLRKFEYFGLCSVEPSAVAC
jgi:hypothetical protein